jgi:hypothetical protein
MDINEGFAKKKSESLKGLMFLTAGSTVQTSMSN